MTNNLITNTIQMKTIAEMIRPDDIFYWTAEQIAKEMPGFSFQGVGWYTRPEAVMLIVPDGKTTTYQLWVFYNRDPRVAFQALNALPERLAVAPSDEGLPSTWKTKLILDLGLFALLLASIYVGVHFGWLVQLPIIFLMIIWTTYIRRMFLKGKS